MTSPCGAPPEDQRIRHRFRREDQALVLPNITDGAVCSGMSVVMPACTWRTNDNEADWNWSLELERLDRDRKLLDQQLPGLRAVDSAFEGRAVDSPPTGISMRRIEEYSRALEDYFQLS